MWCIHTGPQYLRALYAQHSTSDVQLQEDDEYSFLFISLAEILHNLKDKVIIDYYLTFSRVEKNMKKKKLSQSTLWEASWAGYGSGIGCRLAVMR